MSDYDDNGDRIYYCRECADPTEGDPDLCWGCDPEINGAVVIPPAPPTSKFQAAIDRARARRSGNSGAPYSTETGDNPNNEAA